MQLTIDSTEPLESVLAVLSSMYQVHLSAGSPADAPTVEVADSPVAAKAGKGAARGTGKAPAAGGGSRGGRRNRLAVVDASAVRVWARDNGLAVSVRGQLPAGLISAYRDAHV